MCPARRELAFGGITRYFDENVFKTKLETERSVSFAATARSPAPYIVHSTCLSGTVATCGGSQSRSGKNYWRSYCTARI